MSFYRRYNGYGRALPGALAPAPGTAPIAPVVSGPIVALPARQPPAAVYTPVNPPFPIGPQAPILNFLSPRPIQPLIPLTSPAMPPIVPGPAQAILPGRQPLAPKPTGQTMVFNLPARNTAPASQDFVETSKSNVEDAIKKAAEETAARVKAADDAAQAEAKRAREYAPPPSPGSGDGAGGGGGGGGGSDEQLVEVPLTDGTTAGVVVKSHPILAAGGAGALGFLLGGPLGALLGAAAGYYFGKPRVVSSKIAYYR